MSEKINSGLIAGIIACFLALMGTIPDGVIFIPLAASVASIGAILAVKNMSWVGIGFTILAWVFTMAAAISA